MSLKSINDEIKGFLDSNFGQIEIERSETEIKRTQNLFNQLGPLIAASEDPALIRGAISLLKKVIPEIESADRRSAQIAQRVLEQISGPVAKLPVLEKLPGKGVLMGLIPKATYDKAKRTEAISKARSVIDNRMHISKTNPVWQEAVGVILMLEGDRKILEMSKRKYLVEFKKE